MECYLTVNVILTDAELYCSITLHDYRYISQQLFYYKINVCDTFPVIYTIKTIDFRDG